MNSLAPILAALGLAAAPLAQKRLDLTVVFAGDQPARTERFAELLGKHVKHVETVALAKLEPANVQGADVVVVDWQQSNRALAAPLGERGDWTRPTVLLGSAGLMVARPWRVKGAAG